MSYFLAILPQILLLVLGILVLFLDLVIPVEQRRNLGWVTAVGMGLIMVITLLAAMPGPQSTPVWGGMVRYDYMGFAFAELFIFGAAITALFSMDVENLGNRGEFYLLLIAATIGMCFMASASNLIMLYLAIETVSIPMYVLSGFFGRSEKSTEAGFKYFLFGAMTSAIMLYGLSLLYGVTGTTDLSQIVQSMGAGRMTLPMFIGILLLILVGFFFKISAVPMHFWAPDVYEGAPTPVAGFLSTASKAAGFIVLLRVLEMTLGDVHQVWGPILAAVSVATMTLGNLIALAQRNVKRLLAYSSIAHAGYILIGFVALPRMGLGMISVVYYLVAYLVTNLAAFGVVTIYGRTVGTDDVTAYYGLSRRSPWLALAMMVAFLSLAGMPPLAGFVAKVFVFSAAVQSGLIWLAVIGVLNSIIGLYYYLTILKYVYLYRSDNDDQPVPVTRPLVVSMVVLCATIILVGVVLNPWFTWATTAAASMFN
jgi:NADH-quinone oxidoreductase subunit N